MILLLGARGYVGSEFRHRLEDLHSPYTTLLRSEFDSLCPKSLTEILLEKKISFLINAAGYTGYPNIEACEQQKTECLLGNAVFPGIVRVACEDTGIPWGHVSTGCIYSGRRNDGKGFRETDCPNFSFRDKHSSFYSGSKALGEEVLEGARQCYIWRLRMPFNEHPTPKNYLTKLMSYSKLLEVENSISHLGDFVSSCLQSMWRNAPYGIYNLTNHGSIMTSEITRLITATIKPERRFDFFDSEAEFMRTAAKVPRSNCVLDTSKSEQAGIAMRPVTIALMESLALWPSLPK
jgi:dTDP-4-dehydrorhamnose reductase